MKTASYNPSPLEVEFAKAIEGLKDEIVERLSFIKKIKEVQNQIDQDNPLVRIIMDDHDGDEHILVLKIIQKPDHD